MKTNLLRKHFVSIFSSSCKCYHSGDNRTSHSHSFSNVRLSSGRSVVPYRYVSRTFISLYNNQHGLAQPQLLYLINIYIFIYYLNIFFIYFILQSPFTCFLRCTSIKPFSKRAKFETTDNKKVQKNQDCPVKPANIIKVN